MKRGPGLAAAAARHARLRRIATRALPVDVTGTRDCRARTRRDCRAPLFVLPNGGGLGYGLFVLDDAAATICSQHIEEIADALTRGSAWVTLWDNLLDGACRAGGAARRARSARCRARAMSRTRSACWRTSTRVFWRFIPPDERSCASAGARGGAAGRTRARPRRRARRRRGSTPIATRC